MNLFNALNKSFISGMMLPAATVLTFSALLLTLGYMDRILNKKIDIDFRIAKVKARLNAESGVSITIAGPTANGEFLPSLGSSDWPPGSYEDTDVYESNIIDTETFAGYHKPEIPSSFFPAAGIPSTTNIDMGEFYNITLESYQNEVTRRPERGASAYGRAKVKNYWGEDVYLTDSAEVTYTVEVLSDFMYLTHHELAGGAPGIYGPTGGDSDERRQPCFGGSDALGTTEQSLVGFVQTLDPMLICSAFPYPTFDNLVYVTEATDNSYTNPPNWITSEFNTTNVSENEPIMPDFSLCGCDEDDIFLSDEGLCDGAPCGWEMKDPVCFPLQGYKDTVLGATIYDTYDATEMLRFSNGNASAKDTLIMTEIHFLAGGGYRLKRWWYLMPPYLHSEVLTCNGNIPNGSVETSCTGIAGFNYQLGRPWMLEGMPTDFDPTTLEGNNAGNDAIANQISNECEGQNAWSGDMTRCDQYEESLHDFSSLKVNGHPQAVGPILLPSTYSEVFNTDYQAGFSQMNDGPGGGVTRLSHYDIENFTDYFNDKGWENASLDWPLNTPYTQGGNLIQDEIKTHPEGAEVIIYVKGGPVRVHGAFKGAYTVVTSGWDSVDGNNCLDAGCAGYDGYSTYRRHAWFNPAFGGAPIDTIPTSIWITNDLINADAQFGGPPQPDIYDPWGNLVCDFAEPGDCGGSKNIMGLVSAANVVIANSPANRSGGIDLHASVVALNESFVMQYWQHAYTTGCAGNPPYDLGDGGSCSQTPPHADNRGRQIYGNTEPAAGRGDLRLWGGIIQKFRGYMMRNNPGPYITNDIGMDKDYSFDNNLYFPPPGAIKITECQSNTVRMSMIDYGMIRP